MTENKKTINQFGGAAAAARADNEVGTAAGIDDATLSTLETLQ